MELTKTKAGEMLSYTSYVEVLKVGVDHLEVKDTNGLTFTIKGKKLINSMINSSKQYTSEKKVSQTELVEKLLSAKDTVFTAKFEKQNGEDRVLVGHLLDTENHMGRSNVIDLEAGGNNPMRQIDHRTLEYIILKGVKYTRK